MPQKNKERKLHASWFHKLRARFFPTYEDLVAERNWLQESIWHWQYPDGTHVPQKKRQRMFGEIERLNRKIKRHPDHPAKSGKPEETAESPKAAPGSDP